MNWSLLLYRIPKLRNHNVELNSRTQNKLWMNLKKLKYNCNQQCINSIAAEFPAEIHCNFLSFSFNGKSCRFSATEIYTLTLALMLEQVCGLKKAWFIFRFFFRILSQMNQKNYVRNFKNFRNYHSNVEWKTTAELLTQTLNWITVDFLACLRNRNWNNNAGVAHSNLN